MAKGKQIFIIGGARSGKSTLAVSIARGMSRKSENVYFLATAYPGDREMAKRIEKHRHSRPEQWITVEERLNPAGKIKKFKRKSIVIIDCLTLLISNMMAGGWKEKKILKEIKETILLLKKKEISAVIVTNETGLGIVPVSALARDFRDICGRVNQYVAGISDRVYFVVAGISRRLK